MPVAHDGEANQTATLNDVSTASFSKTTAGSNRCAICHGAWDNVGGTVSTLTYGGTAMTLVRSRFSNGVALLYRFVNPATASTTVELTLATGVFGGFACSSYNTVDQTTPISNTAEAGGNATAMTVNVVSANGEVAVDAGHSGSGTNLTIGANQTAILDVDPTVGQDVASREAATGSPVTMSWNNNNDGIWEIVAASLKEVAAAGWAHLLSTHRNRLIQVP